MTLLIGYGNPGRGDDGLGPAFAGRIADLAVAGVEVLIDYQLKVEHALLVARAPQVVFVDAQMGGAAPFSFAPLSPAQNGDVTSHSLPPAAVLTLAQTLYGAAPAAFILGIAGAEFGRVHEGLSAVATHNLDLAEAFFLDWLAASPAPRAAQSAIGQAHA